MTSFEVLDPRKAEDAARWVDIWSRWPRREIFAHPDYALLFDDGGSVRARAAVYRAGELTVLYPFLLRSIEGNAAGDGLRDITSPYGYGGPFAWGSADSAGAAGFWSAFGEWATRECVVSEFIRFDLFPDQLLEYPGVRVERSQNIVRSLDLAPDAMWTEFDHKVRKNVRKAQRSGLDVVFDAAGSRLDEFVAIYYDTMTRRGATQSYYFEPEFFETLNRELTGHYVYAHVLKGGDVISTELILVSAESIYSFLGGTLSSAFEYRPNDLLKFEVIEWARSQGKRHFVLGGGYQPDDGIFRYKRAFAPGGVVPFFTGTRILDPANYDRLVEASRAAGRDTARSNFFPLYRA